MVILYVFIFLKDITKTRLSKYIENFTTKKFQIKTIWYCFHISAQNIDCVYSLELPRGGSNEYQQSMFLSKIRKIMYTSVNSSFTFQKVGFKGVKII